MMRAGSGVLFSSFDELDGPCGSGEAGAKVFRVPILLGTTAKLLGSICNNPCFAPFLDEVGTKKVNDFSDFYDCLLSDKNDGKELQTFGYSHKRTQNWVA